jgi:hypothetical protein
MIVVRFKRPRQYLKHGTLYDSAPPGFLITRYNTFIDKQKKQGNLSPVFCFIVVLIFLALTFYRIRFFDLCPICAPVYMKCMKIVACQFLSAVLHYRVVCWSWQR